jgi:hypothetical protein
VRTIQWGNGSATIAWDAPASTGGAALTDFEVQYQKVGTTRWTTFAHDAFTAPTRITVTGLVNGTAYKVRVAARNRVGVGAFGEIPNAVTPAASPPSPPRNLTGVPGDDQ